MRRWLASARGAVRLPMIVAGSVASSAVVVAIAITTGGSGGACPVSTSNVPGGPDPFGTCWPSPQNTGVPAGTTLTTVSGTVQLNTDGQTYQDRIVNGCIEVVNDNITIKNVRINMPAGGCSYGICNVPVACGAADGGTNTGLVVQDVEVNCGSDLTSGKAAIADQDYTVQRAYFHGNCTNTVSMSGGNNLVEDSFVDEPIDTTTFNDQDPGYPHTDAFQVANSSNVTIRHNTIYGNYVGPGDFGSGAMNVGGSAYSNVLVTRNIIAGGGYSTYCPVAGGGFSLTQNYFSTHFVSTVGGFGPSSGCAAFNGNGNVYLETGLPVTLG